MQHKLWGHPIFKPTGTGLLGSLAVVLIGLASLGREMVWLPLVLTAVASAIAGLLVVPLLRQLKTGQIIREDGPQAHLKKAGTPTMGGIFLIPPAVVVAMIWSQFNPAVVAVSLVTLAYGAIGWVDDWQVLRLRSNKGISPRMKLFLQIAVAIAFCGWLAFGGDGSPHLTTVALPGGVTLPLGLGFWALAGFVMVAESNATNLTDGVDGLAGGTGAIASVGLGLLVLPHHPELTIFCLCLGGACWGFVWFNRNPAQVFMGDTGSLALGAALAAVAILSGQLWGLFLVSGIFFGESLSVIAQVLYFKATKDEQGQGKRLLRMAPFHHHLELGGWQETQIVGMFYLVNVALVLLALVWRA